MLAVGKFKGLAILGPEKVWVVDSGYYLHNFQRFCAVLIHGQEESFSVADPEFALAAFAAFFESSRSFSCTGIDYGDISQPFQLGYGLVQFFLLVGVVSLLCRLAAVFLPDSGIEFLLFKVNVIAADTACFFQVRGDKAVFTVDLFNSFLRTGSGFLFGFFSLR